jgi:hypothetical protein
MGRDKLGSGFREETPDEMGEASGGGVSRTPGD